MTTKEEINPGDTVEHNRYGIGKVMEEWGTFFTCRGCIQEVPMPPETSSELGKRKKRLPTPCCGDVAQQVSGEGVFDIQFKDKVNSINKRWLRKV